MSRHETKFYLKALIIGLFIILISSYGIYELWNYLTGPEITVTSLVNGSAVSESLVSIEGRAKNIKEITLNDRPIVVDEAGNFKEKLLLAYGYNVLRLSAKDRFGKLTEQDLQIVYK